MSAEQITPLQTFTFEGITQSVVFDSRMEVVPESVACDVYTFENDNTKDLGIIHIQPGGKTPLQRVKQGDRTVEGFIKGKGRLIINKGQPSEMIYEVSDQMDIPLSIKVEIDQTMQWQADEDSELAVYEICFPPYKDGRYENLPE